MGEIWVISAKSWNLETEINVNPAFEKYNLKIIKLNEINT